MKIYTYGIIDCNEKIKESIEGLEGASVYNIPYRDIGIIVSGLNKEIQDINLNYALKHEEVVEKLMANFTILPIRFLTIFDGKEDILAMMEEYYKDFRENLDNLRNKVEFSIKIIWPADKIKQRIMDAYSNSKYDVSILPDSPAKGFIKDKFEKYKIDKEFEEEADRCINIIESFFNRFASEKKLEKLKSENLLLNASYLVEKEKESDFKQAFEQMKNDTGDLKYLFSGPWPPYDFIVLTKNPQPFRNISEIDIFDRILQRRNLTGKKAI